MTQKHLSDLLDISNRSLVSDYESGRVLPSLETIVKLSGLFNLPIDELVRIDLEKVSARQVEQKDMGFPSIVNEKVRVLSITVNDQGNENIEFVSMLEASAGYPKGYADIEYIAALPKFNLPKLGNGTFRAFEIKGLSMLPIPSGSIIVCRYIATWQEIKKGKNYVVITLNDGILYKKVENLVKEEGKLLMVSHNKAYKPFKIDISEVLEIWEQKVILLYEDLVIQNEFEEIISYLQRIEHLMNTKN